MVDKRRRWISPFRAGEHGDGAGGSRGEKRWQQEHRPQSSWWVMTDNSGGNLKRGETKSKQKVTVNSCDDTLWVFSHSSAACYGLLCFVCLWVAGSAWVGAPGKHAHV